MKDPTQVVEHFLTIPKGGDSSTITEEKANLTGGICTLIEVIFPPGPSGLVGVRVLQGVHQLIPEANTPWLIGDDITYPHAAPVNLLTGSRKLRILGYNEDDTYDHTIIIRFSVTVPIADPVVAITELLRTRIPDELPFYMKAFPDMLAEIINTKLLLENYVVPVLDQMNKREEDRWRSEIRNQPIEQLARL